VQSSNEPTKQQSNNQPEKLVLSDADEQKLARYLSLLIKIDQRRKKELAKNAA
jgi:hypothetical protein